MPLTHCEIISRCLVGASKSPYILQVKSHARYPLEARGVDGKPAHRASMHLAFEENRTASPHGVHGGRAFSRLKRDRSGRGLGHGSPSHDKEKGDSHHQLW